MRRWIGVALSALVLLGSIGMFAVSLGARSDSNETLEGARSLRRARLAVAEAERALGNSDLGEAVTAARSANRVALKVGDATSRIVRLLRETDKAAATIAASARRGTRGAVFTRRQTEIVGDALGAIAGYQRAASRFTGDTNRALRRILAALRKTNEEFPGGGG
ncbi:MAG: hypothetical protein ACRDLB_13925 [Actinomycetota bacterium]